MQIRKRIKTEDARTKFEKSLSQELLSYGYKLAELLNGGMKYTDNFDAQIKTVPDTGSADTQFAVAHTLKRVPEGFHVLNISAGAIVYDAGTTWTTTNIYLKCTVANCEVKLLIF